ncbi:MAG: T9SS type A sorting domain-containing protein [Candidatus Zixiibacteriota bacterium]
MKKAILLILLLSLFVSAAERTTLVELFTNTGCGPCLSHNIYLDNNEPIYRPLFTLIRTHVSWPSASDPYYLRNTSQAFEIYDTRYGVSSVPHTRVDGNDQAPSVVNIMDAQALSTPVIIDLSYSGGTATADIIVESSLAGSNYRLFFVLIEDDLSYSAPNGQTIFHQTMREYFPSTDGTPISLSSIGTESFVQAIDFGLADVVNNCRIVCYIQDISTLDVVQSAQVFMEDYGYTLYPSAGKYSSSMGSGASGSEYITIYNDHPGDDSYTVDVTVDAPPEWTVTTLADGTPFTGSTTISVDGQSQKNLSVDYNTNYVRGYATIEFETISSHVSGDRATQTGSINISAGCNVLVVDDDQLASFQGYFMDAVFAAGRYPYHHDRELEGVPLASFMDDFEAVVWLTGTGYSDVINSNDITQLSDYLDGGGRLFITGQEIGYDIGGGDGDPSSEDPFYLNYLHANFEGDDASSSNVYGLTGDVIADGIDFSISGGDGADNQDYPDYISGRDAATEIFAYGSEAGSQKAMIRWTDGSTYMVYSGFGFEGIDNQADRNLLMQRILDWFDVSLDIKENAEYTSPEKLTIDAYPNPFNSSVALELPDDLNIAIYDLDGRLVDILPKGSINWQPKSAIESGVYMILAIDDNDAIVANSRVFYIK